MIREADTLNQEVSLRQIFRTHQRLLDIAIGHGCSIEINFERETSGDNYDVMGVTIIGDVTRPYRASMSKQQLDNLKNKIEERRINQ